MMVADTGHALYLRVTCKRGRYYIVCVHPGCAEKQEICNGTPDTDGERLAEMISHTFRCLRRIS